MANLVFIGSISGPFGLIGEVKVKCEINHQEKIFKVGQNFYINNEKYTVKTVRNHQNKYLVTFQGLDSIESIDKLLKQDIFINRDDLHLKTDEFLYSELLDYIILEGKENLGKVHELLYNKNTFFIKNDNLIIPLIPKYLEKVDVKQKIIYVRGSGELRL